MSSRSLFLLLIIFALFLSLPACEGNGERDENGNSDTTAVSNEESDSITEEENGEDDTSERLSPPRQAAATIGDLNIRIDYSSPGVKDRKIWGGLVPFDEIWRTGANEATVLEISEDVVIKGETLEAGKYSLFTIPRKDGDWTVVINQIWDQWGHFNYDEDFDVMRFDATPVMVDSFTERMKFTIEKEDDQTAIVELAWEKLRLPFRVKIAREEE